jgi:alpha-L-fucosidase
MARWMDVNSQAIFGTRPWIAYGEGPAREPGGSFNEGATRPYGAGDIRFTTKRGVLYAIALGWPADGKLVVRSLATVPGVTGEVRAVRLLGHKGPLQWVHDGDGLTVTMPDAKPCEHAYVLKITGQGLRGFKPELTAANEAAVVLPDAAGDVVLEAGAAELHGSQIRIEQRIDRPNIGFWDSPDDWASWTIKLSEPATYSVTAQCASAVGPTEFVVELDGEALVGNAPDTGSWDDYATVSVGALSVRAPGTHVLKVRPRDPTMWKPMNLVSIRMAKHGKADR